MKKILLTGIRFYQKYLSPIKGCSTCKYYPTCSRYAIEAIEKYGALKEDFWQCGEFCVVIRFQKEDTTLFLKKDYKIHMEEKMIVSLLTAANWPIVGQICWVLGKVMNFIYTI